MSCFGKFQPLPAIAGQIRDETGFGEALLQVVARFGLVFDDQYFHGGRIGVDERILPQLMPSVACITNMSSICQLGVRGVTSRWCPYCKEPNGATCASVVHSIFSQEGSST